MCGDAVVKRQRNALDGCTGASLGKTRQEEWGRVPTGQGRGRLEASRGAVGCSAHDRSPPAPRGTAGLRGLTRLGDRTSALSEHYRQALNEELGRGSGKECALHCVPQGAGSAVERNKTEEAEERDEAEDKVASVPLTDQRTAQVDASAAAIADEELREAVDQGDDRRPGVEKGSE